MDIQKTIDDYDVLKDMCFDAITFDPESTLGEHAWLRGSIDVDDIFINFFRGNRLYFYGSVYSSHTVQHEGFSGSINFYKD